MTPTPIAAFLALALAAGGAADVKEAERLSAAAQAEAGAQPASALTKARRALELSADFEPTVFVKAGRKGEVVEDEFQAARAEYRQHRARVYDAMGEALARSGSADAGVRYLRRAVLLDPAPARALRLARVLLQVARPLDALLVVQDQMGLAGMSPELRAFFEQAADAASLPSAQFEIDRARLRSVSAGPIEPRDGPFTVPVGTRLSTGVALALGDAPLAIYTAEASCKTCSQDLQDLKRVLPAGAKIVVVSETPDEDHALRQVMGLYRLDWPVILGRGVAEGLGLEPRTVTVVARRGFAGARVRPPFAALPAALSILAQRDLDEPLPRERWSRLRRTPEPARAPLPLHATGLAPGEDEPAPPEFAQAVEAYAAGRYAEALRLVEALASRADAWLLLPEARLDRALCLAGLGQRDEARRLLLRTGDSRFQDEVDRALDRVGSPAGPRARPKR